MKYLLLGLVRVIFFVPVIVVLIPIVLVESVMTLGGYDPRRYLHEFLLSLFMGY